jgi:integrase
MHPRDIGASDVERFLSDLTVNFKVSASTQRQALNALFFLYREVLDLPLDDQIQPVRSKKKPKLPTVLGIEEIKRFFRYIDGNHALMAKILFGSGLPLMECVRLRIKDLDFDHKRIHVLGKEGTLSWSLVCKRLLKGRRTEPASIRELPVIHCVIVLPLSC